MDVSSLSALPHFPEGLRPVPFHLSDRAICQVFFVVG